MLISPDDLRRQSLVTTRSLTAAAIIWCTAFGLTVVLDEFAAPGWLFAASLTVCLAAFLYVLTAVLVTWAYTSARKVEGTNWLFDGRLPLRRMVVREAVRG